MNSLLTKRLLLGAGSLLYGGLGVGGFLVYPMSIMIFDAPNATSKPHNWCMFAGVLGFPVVTIDSAWEMALAARRASSTTIPKGPIVAPLVYTAAVASVVSVLDFLEKNKKPDNPRERR